MRWPDLPLTPRHGQVVAYLPGQAPRVVVIGGLDGRPCPVNADCVYDSAAEARDGAALDLTTGEWTPIADAPRSIVAWPGPAVIGDELFLIVNRTLLVWHSLKDQWREITVPGPKTWPNLVADGRRLILVSPSDEREIHPDRVYDTATGRWSTLPRDPLKPAFGRTLTATPKGLVLTAKSILPDGTPEDPALVKAAVVTKRGKWRRLPTSDQLGGESWTWTGTRLVDPTLGGADGGQVNNYGRVIPYGGILDPASGTWSRLISPPEGLSPGWRAGAEGGPLIATNGLLYDDSLERWRALPAAPKSGAEVPGPSVWADGSLFVIGGQTWTGIEAPLTAAKVYSTQVWAFKPAETSD